MAAILFGPHKPDQANLNSSNAIVSNVVPRLRGYGPLPGLSAISSALAAQPLGAFVARTASNTFVVFVGTATKLYKYNSATLGWTDVTRSVGGNYAASTTAPWEFAQFGTKLYATNINDVLQSIDIDSGTNFAAVAGSPPQAGKITVMGDFLVLGQLSGFPTRVHWSAINDPTGWTAGTNSSDTQDMPDGGIVTGFAGYDAGLVFQSGAVRRMIFTPGGEPDYVFRFEKVSKDKGAISGRAITTVGDQVFFLSNDGFFKWTPYSGFENIGYEAVNESFISTVSQTNLKTVQGAYDPLHSRVYWAYTSSDSANSYYNKLLIYDWATKMWSTGNVSQYLILPGAVAGVTLDGLDSISASIDALGTTLDSSAWAGGAPVLASFDTSFKLSFYQGSNLEATLETGELEPAPGQTSFVRKVRPETDCSSSVYVSLKSRRRLSDTITTSNETTPESDGMCSQRASGRYHQFKLRIPAASTWTYAIGLDPDAVPEGQR